MVSADYFFLLISKIVVVLLISCDTTSSAFPLGLSSPLMKRIPSGEMSDRTGVGILHEKRPLRIRDVIDHNAAGSLEADKRIGSAKDFADRNTLRFWSLVVAACIE